MGRVATDLTGEERDLIRRGRGLEAVQAIRARTGCGLAEAVRSKRAYSRAWQKERRNLDRAFCRMLRDLGIKP